MTDGRHSALGRALLQLARSTLTRHFASDTPLAVCPDLPELTQPGASFVTLTQHGQLRGCIGSLEAWRPLRDDVCANALSAALHDPRFNPLTHEELARTRIEVSRLSAPQPLLFRDEADALAQLRPGIDGVIFSAGPYRSTFLPQVWAQLPDPVQFIAHLKQKAGLNAHDWRQDVQLATYTVDKWKEEIS